MKKYRDNLGLLEDGHQAIYPDVPTNEEKKSAHKITFTAVIDKLLEKLDPLDIEK
jgi:hypothetical protein